MFFSGGHDLKFNTWIPETGLESTPIQVPSLKAKLLEVSLSYDNSFAAVLRENEKPMIYTIKEKPKIRLIQLINVPDIVCLTFKRNTKRILALGTGSGEIVLYDTKLRSTFLRTESQDDLTINSLAYTCDDQQLCGINEGVLLIVPEINKKNPKIEKQKLPLPTTTFECHPIDSNLVVIGCANGCAIIWDIKARAETVRVDLLKVPVVSLKVCKGFLVAAGGKSLTIYGLEQGKSASQFHFEQKNEIKCMNISGDHSYIGLGLSDGSVKLCDLRDQMKTVADNQIHDESLCKLVFMHKPRKNASYNISEKASFPVIHENVTAAELQKYEVPIPLPAIEENSKGDNGEMPPEQISPSTSDQKVDELKSRREKNLEIMRSRLLHMVKSEMVYLSGQLEEHCVKFQNFLNSDFETLNDIIRNKWDIFSSRDIDKILAFISTESKDRVS